ncbi:MAG TPA: sensor domain-containing diguanylate cyclase [Mycobacteriales bacterium]|nr:sensor domain-containing diguanylate cyclase [Mycobacteriales bacterium]
MLPPAPGGAEPSVSPERARAARATMEELAAAPDVFATFFEQARIGLALADLAGRYVRVNATYAALLGRPPEDLVGEPLAAVLQPDAASDAVSDADVVASLLAAGRDGVVQTEQRCVHPDGRVRWLLHGVSLVPDATGRPAWFAVSAQDVTERRRAEQDLRDLAAVLSERAVRDPLTGLANRGLLEERLRAALSRDARAGLTGLGTAVLFLDLDGFKGVNDTAGHDAGDAVLRAVARRLTAAVRPSDTVARLGGDEFVVLVEQADPADLAPLAARLRRSVGQPVQVPGAPGTGEVRVGTSVGTAWCAAGELDARTLLRQADEAMYADKRARAGG